MLAQVIEIFHWQMSPEVAGIQTRLADCRVFHLAIECAVFRDRTRLIARQDPGPWPGILQCREQDGTSGSQQYGNEYPKAQESSGIPP